MSIKAVNWALNDVQCQPDFKVILIAMGERADDNGLCFPTQSELAKKTCIPLRTLKRKVQHLVELDVITKVTKQVERNLRRNTYRLHLEQRFNMLDKHPVVSKQDSANLAPLIIQPENTDGATVAPLIVPTRHHQEQQWCHPDGTINSATHVAYKPSVNHQYSNTSSLNTTEASVFDSKPVPSRQRITLTTDWQPSEHVFDKLSFARGITRQFAMEQLDGFVLYHDQTTDRQQAFDSKFHSHVIRNWEMSKTEARPLAKSWKPDELTVRRLRQGGISEDFIDERAIEFVIYWLENGKSDTGWNAKFYDAVMRAWNRAVGESQAATAGALSVRQSVAQATPQTMNRTIERITDRSWAEG